MNFTDMLTVAFGLIATYWIVALVLSFILYFFPWMIAKLRGHQTSGWLFFFNLLLGWTLLGWIACLVWSIFGEKRPANMFDNPNFVEVV